MTVEELFEIIPSTTKIRICSSYNGKVRAYTNKKAKEFKEYTVVEIRPKIKVEDGRYSLIASASPYLEIHIRDYDDWKGGEPF